MEKISKYDTPISNQEQRTRVSNPTVLPNPLSEFDLEEGDRQENRTLEHEAYRRINEPIMNDDGSGDYIGLVIGSLYNGDPIPYGRLIFPDY